MNEKRDGEAQSEDQNIHYDHIMLLEDRGRRTSQESNFSKVAFLATCAFVSLLGGFGLHLAIGGRRYRGAVKVRADPKNIDKQKVTTDIELEDPMLLATRALGWGSLYAVIGSGTIGLAAFYIFRV